MKLETWRKTQRKKQTAKKSGRPEQKESSELSMNTCEETGEIRRASEKAEQNG